MADTDAAWFDVTKDAVQPGGENDRVGDVPTEWLTLKTLAEVFAFISAAKPHVVFGKYWDAVNESEQR